MGAASQSFGVKDSDGIEVVVDRWDPPGARAGVVQILHGWAEHAGRYGRLAKALADAGWIVYADDHRGHGRTGTGQVGGLGDLGPGGQDGVLLSVRAVAERVAAGSPGLPIVLLGHSWGSFILQRYLPIWGAGLAGAVLTGTTHRVEGVRREGGFNAAFEPVWTPYDWLSRDEVEVDKYVADPWCGFERMQAQGGPAADWHRVIPDPVGVPSDLPILILNGGDDPIGGEVGGQALADHYRSSGVENVTFIGYPGGRHEPFNETNRDQVTADLLAWLSQARALMPAIALDVVAPDGMSAVLTRLVLLGESSTLVLVAVTPDAVWASIEGLPAGRVTGAEETLAIYEQQGTASAAFTRRGPPGMIEGVEVVAAGMADVLTGEGPGSKRGALGIEASMARVVVSRPTECIGEVRAEVRLPTGPMVVEGWGLLSEERDPDGGKDAALSLRGQHLCAGVRASHGWVWRAGSSQDATEVVVDPPSNDRAVRFGLADGTAVEGHIAVTRSWPIARSSGAMEGAIVVGVVGGASVVGHLLRSGQAEA